MKLLFDQNLSPKLVEKLKDLYPESICIPLIDIDKRSEIII